MKPAIILADDINDDVHASTPGRPWYYRARGERFSHGRFRCAWLVFTGQADALVWQGEPIGDAIVDARRKP